MKRFILGGRIKVVNCDLWFLQHTFICSGKRWLGSIGRVISSDFLLSLSRLLCISGSWWGAASFPQKVCCFGFANKPPLIIVSNAWVELITLNSSCIFNRDSQIVMNIPNTNCPKPFWPILEKGWAPPLGSSLSLSLWALQAGHFAQFLGRERVNNADSTMPILAQSHKYWSRSGIPCLCSDSAC